MPTTLTLRNVPAEVYDRLKAMAEARGRSLNNEAIACLKSALMPARISATERIERARALRSELSRAKYNARDIDALKRGQIA